MKIKLPLFKQRKQDLASWRAASFSLPTTADRCLAKRAVAHIKPVYWTALINGDQHMGEAEGEVLTVARYMQT
jgi:hypothetical protein